MAQNASADISEKAGHAHYPALLVYCDKMSNTLKEKFRRFSGKAHMVVEVRHSQDRLDTIEANLQMYVDAVCALLDDSRGRLGLADRFTQADTKWRTSRLHVAERISCKGRRVGFDVEVSK